MAVSIALCVLGAAVIKVFFQPGADASSAMNDIVNLEASDKFRQMMVYVDPAKLQAYHVSATDVVEAMQKSNLVLAAGTARMGGTD